MPKIHISHLRRMNEIEAKRRGRGGKEESRDRKEESKDVKEESRDGME